MADLKTSMRNRDYSKALAFIYGFVVGADCISDVESLFDDAGFRHFCKSDGLSASCLGMFLAAIPQYSITKITENLRDFAFKSRQQVNDDKDFVIDTDSTFHA